MNKNAWLALAAIIGIFALITYLSNTHIESLKRFVGDRPFVGVFMYIALCMTDAIFPGSAIALVPVAGRVWGIIPGIILTTAAWTAGSLIAFYLARRFGKPFVHHFISEDGLRIVKRFIPNDLFWGVVMVRLILPFDLASYAVGLFTSMDGKKFAAATALGVLPTATVLTLLGKLPTVYEIFVYAVGVIILFWVFNSARRMIAER